MSSPAEIDATFPSVAVSLALTDSPVYGQPMAVLASVSAEPPVYPPAIPAISAYNNVTF